MKKTIYYLLTALAFFLVGWFLKGYLDQLNDPNSVITPIINFKPLEKYSIKSLTDTDVEPGTIKRGEVISELDNHTSYNFEFEFSPDLSGKRLKTTTGQINLPDKKGRHPIVLMIRGYVDQEIYFTGLGTRKAASVFADNGYITVAPDFLGYGESSGQSTDILESRFQTYTTVLSLLESLNQIKEWNKKDILIWAHSNGGQIAVTLLEMTGEDYPTTLWAPVTKPFPYSILYYTDELEDEGKYLRRELAKFENKYSASEFSLTNYLDQIKAPIQIHQGTGDEAVPFKWNSEFSDTLDDKDIDITYFQYPGANHNLVPSWDTVVQRDLNFLNRHLP